MLSLRNIGYQCKIGISALLGEATMGVLMLMGNLMFMHYVGNDGVGAFSIACYYCPFVFMIGISANDVKSVRSFFGEAFEIFLVIAPHSSLALLRVP